MRLTFGEVVDFRSGTPRRIKAVRTYYQPGHLAAFIVRKTVWPKRMNRI
jgi:hypothetical protein